MKKFKIGVFKFTSCGGCQLSILNLEEEILDLLIFFDFSYFKEASDKPFKGDFDIVLAEGSITADWQKKELTNIRDKTRYLIAIGACATSGGIQALKNWSDVIGYKSHIYPNPALISTLSTSTPLSEHIYPDYELPGCPINKDALLEVLISFLINKRPTIPKYSLCMECKRQTIPCLLISKGEPCLGPITMAGCGAICPSLNRPCYGCFGPKEEANIAFLLKRFETLGLDRVECEKLLDKMNTYAFRKSYIQQIE